MFCSAFLKKREIYGPLCIGFDPSHHILQSWNLSFDYKGLKDFCDILLAAVVGHVGIIKPQVAFFELYGVEGLQVLKELIENAHEQGLLVIADAKRGDIGSTVEAYGKAWLGSSSAFKADAITVNAFLGFDALIPLIKVAEETATGVFVVVQSSNPEGKPIRNARIGNQTLSVHLAQRICDYNSQSSGKHQSVGPIGAVIGATLGNESKDTIEQLKNSLFLVPGVGAQGGTIKQLADQFPQRLWQNIIPSVSRSITDAGRNVVDLKNIINSFVEQSQSTLLS
ncbi:orotidine 5'-phosphate decarboxylase [Bartonella quintana]|uniref:orotidine-5'-phosphate decarboxylase n=1 Tax=Bartonella TaxID=773 RepID=UPI00027FCCCA|nr:orotidine-5'-phosphate decarboxylase [Bartonella quintana]AFR26642.1 orotidine 5'-phosphate decarboxylase [Bartonella quintana RM-11]AFR26709.1 orotidine 5'-phosphate decarboxylase [Bartonella quintana RM-11]BBL53717.1 orotidine 5'-phosphate decarboxylase [Bartonella quintana]BBL53793.1 orotidine 5'-phosphate decarboxylase [Bartonella quintana]